MHHYSRSLGDSSWREDVTLENVYLLHGERDVHAPVEMACAIATKIPQCRTRYFADENHMVVVFNHLEEVMQAMSQKSESMGVETARIL